LKNEDKKQAMTHDKMITHEEEELQTVEPGISKRASVNMIHERCYGNQDTQRQLQHGPRRKKYHLWKDTTSYQYNKKLDTSTNNN
jgi:hypothetical protein